MTNITGYFINQIKHHAKERLQTQSQKECKVSVFKQNKHFASKNALVFTA